MLKHASISLLALGQLAIAASANAEPIAKKLFGGKKLPAVLSPAVHGFYSKGCVQGAVAIPKDGPTWQAMRLSRNRRWGHPDLINLVVKLSQDGRKVGWNGLLVGDISQPRGGPMLTGHASHQLGLDADIWLNPMPKRRLTLKERETTSAASMLLRKKNARGKSYLDQRSLDSRRFTSSHFGIIKTAAGYRDVQRIFVHPVIKRELCRREKGNSSWLRKVRPYWGHHYHMHIRMKCPAGSPGCRSQAATPAGDGCGKNLKWWFDVALAPAKPRKKSDPPPKKVKPKQPIRLADLPGACATVLKAAAPRSEAAVTLQSILGQAYTPDRKASAAVRATEQVIINHAILPKFRPVR